MNGNLSRRAFTKVCAAAAFAPLAARAQKANDAMTWLLFTKSAGYEHSVIRSAEGGSYLGRYLTPVFRERGIDLVESKDGRLFEREAISRYAGFVFYTSGDLTTLGTDQQPPMTREGKQNLLDAVSAGVPFIGLHCASDTFHSANAAEIDPYIAMLGGEFESHGEQQVGSLEVVDPTFDGVGDASEWTFHEEWYALKHLAPDIRPIHRLQTADLKGEMYQRPPYPITWTRSHGKGRVFYTALAHREDRVASQVFLRLIGGAVDWCRGR